MKLSSYFRSTAAYRVRIALNLKQVDYDIIPVHLVRNGGEQKSAAYRHKNPEGLVPALEVQGSVLSQSLAIIEYLEEVYPEPALLPSEPLLRAYVRGLAQAITSDIHPLNNLRVLQYLVKELDVTEQQKLAWYQHWVATGFSGLETRLATSPRTGDYCLGATPGIADLCLVPQVYNAQRFNCDMSDYPTISRINEACLALQAFQQAAPEQQVDAE
ncbi:maleylacetoacetate isomerase [Arenicella xantha]|uniref:Maleylacetoacetate isomerase n=1 Tax=Arenicella xantha TaxID=644221 RepID=A0A395JW65_9GAMM|nr:maleylacetoacetate isomerase [Arenicella xantha]RBP53798.1 maleylacetoacetate isomerase [Arenicella xantha]